MRSSDQTEHFLLVAEIGIGIMPEVEESTADLSGHLEITLCGDRDLAGEIIFEGMK